MKNVTNKVIFAAWIILVSIVCGVQGEHKKREVHRIIIQERVPRNHRPLHHDSHHHGKRNQRNNKKGAKGNISSEEGSQSFEDVGSYNMDSFEKHIKPEKLISSKVKTFKKHPKHSHKFGEMKPDATYHRTETKHAFHSEWVPLDADPVAEHFRQSPTRSREPRKPVPKVPFSAYSDTSTQYPFLHYDVSPMLPLTMYSDVPNTFHNLHYLNTLNTINNPNMKQNTIDLTQLAVLPSVQHPDAEIIVKPRSHKNDDRLKNHKLSYEVTEANSFEEADYLMMPEKLREESEENEFGKRERRNKPHSKEGEKVYRRGRSSSHNRGKIRHH